MPRLIPLIFFLAISYTAHGGQEGHAKASPSTEVTRPSSSASELDRLTDDLCGKKIVLLGEGSSHGEVRTREVKTTLVKRLVENCGFDAVFIEAGIFDFLNVEHSIESSTATLKQMEDSIGGLWSSAKESEPWMSYLHEKAVSGSLRVAGIDDQIGSSSFYAQRELPKVLAGYLGDDLSTACEAAISGHVSWKYDEQRPYTKEVQDELTICLSKVEDAIAGLPKSRLHEEHAVMATSLKQFIARDFGTDMSKRFNARDHSMYRNFEWHLDRLPADSKVIVWCASVHAAKNLNKIPSREAFKPIGAYIHDAYGDHAVAIGFSALSGSYALGTTPPQTLSTAPAESIEGQVLGSDAELRYLDRAQLHKLGKITARPFSYKFLPAHWDQHLDGLVVFREERAPQLRDPK